MMIMIGKAGGQRQPQATSRSTSSRFLSIVFVLVGTIVLLPTSTSAFMTTSPVSTTSTPASRMTRCLAQSTTRTTRTTTIPTRTGTTTTTTTTTRLYEKNPFEFLSPYESKIPAEIKDEIYRAEANTPAAQDRAKRVSTYAVIAFIGVLCAFFNVFLGELRAPDPVDGSAGVDLVEAGFGWVGSNPITGFLFLNKIGGGICLVGGAGAGLLAEAEFDTKRINAEKIYEEMIRRREAKEKKKNKKRSSAPTSSSSPSKKKRRSGKESKRLTALSEVVMKDPQEIMTEKEPTGIETATTNKEPNKGGETTNNKDEDNGGIFGKLKGFYDKADSMAASQALLLNKKLEDVGVVEKITDETGLKVIGKDEAAKLQQQNTSSSSSSNNADDDDSAKKKKDVE